MSAAKSLDSRLENLVHEIKEIKKEIIREKMERAGVVRERTVTWTNLGKKISARWDKASIAEEIADQREKQW